MEKTKALALKLRTAVLGVVIAVISAEAGVHISRVNDFPLYDVNNRIGYIPKPNQEGRYLWRNNWEYNALSMGTGRQFQPSEKVDLLLIGDSVVNGGNPMSQEERLGPALEAVTGWIVWPISAGSWGLQNQMHYLLDHPSVTAGVDRIAFVLNESDFEETSSYWTQYSTPPKMPFPALPYVLNRYVFGFNNPPPEPSLTVPRRDPLLMLAGFATSYGKPIDVFLYPTQAEIGQSCNWRPGALMTIPNIRVHCIEDGWNESGYRDSIHPSAKGNQVLAPIVARAPRSAA